MGSIKQTAKEYEPTITKNVSELKKVSVDLDMVERSFTDSEDKPFTVNIITVDEEEYRVPKSVIAQLKEQLEENPKMEFFKVKKKGEGLKTSYTVIPLK